LNPVQDVQTISTQSGNRIGSTTCGKPYGFHATDNCGTTYLSIQFQSVNAKGFGVYPDGFTPAPRRHRPPAEWARSRQTGYPRALSAGLVMRAGADVDWSALDVAPYALPVVQCKISGKRAGPLRSKTDSSSR
jgi:hypothetical protein